MMDQRMMLALYLVNQFGLDAVNEKYSLYFKL
jgi:hypothetical protein